MTRKRKKESRREPTDGKCDDLLILLAATYVYVVSLDTLSIIEIFP